MPIRSVHGLDLFFESASGLIHMTYRQAHWRGLAIFLRFKKSYGGLSRHMETEPDHSAVAGMYAPTAALRVGRADKK
jgi:hypothetical protein